MQVCAQFESGPFFLKRPSPCDLFGIITSHLRYVRSCICKWTNLLSLGPSLSFCSVRIPITEGDQSYPGQGEPEKVH